MPHEKELTSLSFPAELKTIPKPVKRISFMIFVYFLGWGIATPFLPIFFKERLGTYFAVGLITGIMSFIQIIWTIPMGALTQKISKRRLISFFLILYLPLSKFLLMSQTFMHFLYFRIYNSFLASGLWTTSEVYIRQHSKENKTSETIGFFDTGYQLSTVIGPLIGAMLIINYGFNIFYAVSFFAFLAFIISFFLPDHTKSRVGDGFRKLYHDGIFRKSIASFIKEKRLYRISLVAFLFNVSIMFIATLLSLFLKELGANYFQIGIIYSLFFIPRISEAYFSTLADKKSKTNILRIGLLFGALLFFVLFFMKSILTVFIITFLLSVCFSLILPAMEGRFTELMPKRKMGELVGATRAIKLLGMAIGPIIAGYVADLFGINYIFILGAIIFIIILAIVGKKI